MIKLLVYNPDTNSMEEYFLGENDVMPYSPYMSVKEFRGKSRSNIIWTDKRILDSFNTLRNTYGLPIQIGYGFNRLAENKHAIGSNYYAGLALDLAHRNTMEQRDRIRDLARNLNIFNYVLPKVYAPNLVHVEEIIAEPSCTNIRYPILRMNDVGVYVLVLQDALNLLNYYSGNLDGIFGERTKNAVTEFQRQNNLSVDGIVGCDTWTLILQKVSDISI